MKRFYFIPLSIVFITSSLICSLANANIFLNANGLSGSKNKNSIKTEQFHLQQAFAKVTQEQYSFAWGDFAYVLHSDPYNKLALNGISELAPKLGKNNKAIAYFTKAIKLAPSQSSTYEIYAKFLKITGDIDKAKVMLDIAQRLKSNPNYYAALNPIYNKSTKK